MTLYSMTGYGKAAGEGEGLAWTIELKSVNGRGLDVRARMPALFESFEGMMRERLSRHLQRGNISLNISLAPGHDATNLVINENILTRYAQIAKALETNHEFGPSSAAELLSLRGVAEFSTADLSDEAQVRMLENLLASLDKAAEALNAARAQEGARLGDVLSALIDKIEATIAQAAERAGSQPELLRQRLQDSLSKLNGGQSMVEADRIAQEVALLAVKADVQEELDRLLGHVTAARDLLNGGQAIGRAFDFLAQEFVRESNTLCSKSVDGELTRIGLDLKALIEQVREQVRNLE